MDSYTLPLRGGCFCGAVRYRVTKAPLFAMACHCTDCQQMTASAFSLDLIVLRSGFAVVEGAPDAHEKTADSGAISTRFTCPQCACWTHTETTSSPEATVIRPTTLDEPGWVRPVVEIFTRSAFPWARLATPLAYAAEFANTDAEQAVFAAAVALAG